MKLFHGTSLDFGDGILKTGLIKKNQPTYDNVTNPNYVYLADRITCAMQYGHKKALRSETYGQDFYVFELEIIEIDLQVDFDEIGIFKESLGDKGESIRKLNEIYTVENTLPVIHSVRVDHDIDVKIASGKYAKVPSAGIVDTYCEDIRRYNLTDVELAKVYNSLVWKNC
ncbi:hypothetical protein [Bacillus cereus]|uniref:DUF3990 domain-containing protein n=1 Tax=Bacillus cereus TaxID=1396 RepID=A0A0G8ED52_BACCE|nr:hypothetical protein [Bacillus cereus]KLA22219.1 hypothetical protein B4077_3165 [Bacillus cereus]